MKHCLYSILGTILFFSTINSGSAQMVCSLGAAPMHGVYNQYSDQNPSPLAYQEIQTIYRALCPFGCGQFRLVQNHTVPNAMAMAVGPGQTKISYNPNFMNRVAYQYGNGASFGILAHEFGHHIDFHTTPPWMNNSWGRELKADAWAGCALAKVGARTEQIKRSLVAIAQYPSQSHPSWPLRHQAIQTGFTQCGGQWLSGFNNL